MQHLDRDRVLIGSPDLPALQRLNQRNLIQQQPAGGVSQRLWRKQARGEEL